MTEQEIIILNKLAEAWNEFLKLDKFHPSDNSEFSEAIHKAQLIVMARKAVRDCPEYFKPLE